jgi:predicted ATP-grasp superfamily ATP-dependent carboligase
MTAVDRVVVLGSTVTALALVRHARDLGFDCVLLDTKPGVATRTRRARVQIAAADSVERQLLGLAQERRSALIADSDSWLRRLMPLRNELERDFAAVLHPRNDVLETCLNKTRFLEWCAANRLPAPKLHRADERDGLDCSATPVMVRPESTLHGRAIPLPKAIEIRSNTELATLLQQYERHGVIACVSESLIRPRVRQYSVGVARNRTGATLVFVGEKIRPSVTYCAGGTYVVSSFDQRVADLAVAALDALEYFGIAEMEIFLDPETDALAFVEINPRPWVQYPLARKAGFDLLGLLLHPESPPAPPRRQKAASWLSFWDDLYVCFSRTTGMVTTGETSLPTYLKSLLGARSFPIWAWNDPLPAVKQVLDQASRRIGSRR